MIILLSLSACFETNLNQVEEEACEPVDWFVDADGDGYGAGEAESACEVPVGSVDNAEDCDDADPLVFPGAVELCNGLDDDCDAAVDNDPVDQQTWYMDLDSDGFGDPDNAVQACEAPLGAVSNDLDCEDLDPEILPGGTETCDGVDQDCDGQIDELAVDMLTWYLDSDADGWGVLGDEVQACEQPSGYADNPDDCDDADPTLTEVCVPDPTVSASNCSGTFYTWSATEPSVPELNIVSVYEGDGGHGGPAGKIVVDIERETEMTLVLASYEDVDWTVNAASGTTITEILVTGYHDQSVNAPSGVPVSVRSYDQTKSNYGNWCGYSYPYAGGGCDTAKLIAGVEAETGMTMDSFSGCYRATEFSLK